MGSFRPLLFAFALALALPLAAWELQWEAAPKQGKAPALDASWTVGGHWARREAGGLQGQDDAAGAMALYAPQQYSGMQSLTLSASLSAVKPQQGIALFLCADQPARPYEGHPYNGYGFALRPQEGAALFVIAADKPRLLASTGPLKGLHWQSLQLNAFKRGAQLVLSIDGHPLLQVQDASFEGGAVGFGVNLGGPGSATLLGLAQSAEQVKDLNWHPWTPAPGGAILSPSLPWEEKAVYEPSPLWDGKQWLMTYSAGWIQPALGLATSSDGLYWTRQSKSRILGYGKGGEAGHAARSNLLKVGDELRVYYSDTAGNIQLAASTDGGPSFRRRPKPVLAHDAVKGVDGWANQGCLRDGSHWWALVEGECHCEAKWQLSLFESHDNGETFQVVESPVSSLQVGYGSYSSPRAFFKTAHGYDLWYHVAENTLAVPTVLWHAHSTDLKHWIPDSHRSLAIQDAPLGLKKPEQIADPAMLERDGKVWLYFDEVDNARDSARIGLVRRPGSLEDLLQAYPQWQALPPTAQKGPK